MEIALLSGSEIVRCLSMSRLCFGGLLVSSIAFAGAEKEGEGCTSCQVKIPNKGEITRAMFKR